MLLFRILSTMLFFCNNNTVPVFRYFLSRIRNAQPYSDYVIITNRKRCRLAFVSTVIDLRLSCEKLVCFTSSFLMPGGNIGTMTVVKIRMIY